MAHPRITGFSAAGFIAGTGWTLTGWESAPLGVALMVVAGVIFAITLIPLIRERGWQLWRAGRSRAIDPITKRVEDELAAIISRGQEIRRDDLTGPEWDEYHYWKESSADFLGTVLGSKARDRLMREDSAETLAQLLDNCLAAVRGILDELDASRIRVDAEELDAAIEKRRAAPREVTDEMVAEPAEPAEPVADEPPDDPKPRPGTVSLRELEREYREGDRMLKASIHWMRGPLLHGPMPSDADIDAWVGRVSRLLPDRYRGRFRAATLESEPYPALASLRRRAWERDETRRLQRYLGALRRIIQDMD